MIVAIIPARKDSKGLVDKNIRYLGDKPVCEYSIDYALKSLGSDNVIVTSDDFRVVSVGIRRECFAIRLPSELAQDDTRIDYVLRHAVETYEKGGAGGVEIVVLLYACVPIREPNLIERGIELLQDLGGDSVRSYAPVPSRYNSANHLGGKPEYRRQNLKPEWFHDGGMVILRRGWILNPLDGDFGFFGRNCLPLMITDECVNIDSQEHFDEAERKLKGEKDV